jgi:RIO kinase 1
MSPLRPADLLDDDAPEAPAGLPELAAPRSPTASAPRRQKANEHKVRDAIVQHAHQAPITDKMGTEGLFNPTFTSSRHERDWILNFLGPFYDDKQITDVLARVKGGKEANVYCCAAHPGTGLELIAAKLYRPREFRNLRNDLRYRQGRAVLDDRGKVIRDERLLVAISKKTTTGQEAVHTSWLEHEYQTMLTLYEAGADVPRPVSRGHSTILMEYLGEADAPAPTLQAVRLERDEAQPLFERVMHNVGLMLQHQLIHGDLSAYNVLYWEGDIRLIDFPQVVHPGDNPEAFDIFARDVRRLCQYFARQGVLSDPAALAADLWAQYGPPPTSIFDNPPPLDELAADDDEAEGDV